MKLKIVKATAEVYAIDCLVAGVDHKTMARYLDLNEESFETIDGEILKSQDKKLRTIRDNLNKSYSYNQIRFVSSKIWNCDSCLAS